VRITTPRGPLAFAPAHWDALQSAALEAVAAWHAREPAHAGMPADRILRQHGLRLPRETVLAIAGELVRQGVLVRRGMGVALPSHAPRMAPSDEELWQRVQPLLAAGGLRPPSVFELSYALRAEPKGIEAMLVNAAHCGVAVRVSARHYYLPAAVLELADIAQALAGEEAGTFTAAHYRDRCGVGRNLSIELLEFFNQVRFTRRVGDRHVLLAAPREVFAGAGAKR
jgi:selenocysteine-specific elongation factor